jgi:tRNA-binding EMAP/Myf-like protein
MIKGFESNGMIMAASAIDGAFSLLEATGIPAGSTVR